MIKNILFDMGNVLIRFDRNLFLDRLDLSREDKKILYREVFASVEWAHAAADACGLPLAFHSYYENLNPDLPEKFISAGFGSEMLLPMENVTKKLF